MSLQEPADASTSAPWGLRTPTAIDDRATAAPQRLGWPQIADHQDRAPAALVDRLIDRAYAMCLAVVGDQTLASTQVESAFRELSSEASLADPRIDPDAWLLNRVHQRAVTARRRLKARHHPSNHTSPVVTIGRPPSRFAALPADQRSAIQLAYFDGLRVSEIAAAMHVPPTAVKRLLQAGLAALANHRPTSCASTDQPEAH